MTSTEVQFLVGENVPLTGDATHWGFSAATRQKTMKLYLGTVLGISLLCLVGVTVWSSAARSSAARAIQTYVAPLPAQTLTPSGFASRPSVLRPTALKAGVHPSKPSFFSGVVPRNILKPGSKDTGIVAIRLNSESGFAASSECCPPNMEKRQLLNLILLGSTGLTVSTILTPALMFFVPPSGGSGSGSLAALDADGKQVFAADWLKTHLADDRSLVQGLKGDATYLVVGDDNKLKEYGLNAVCTHLGCVVPWNKAENKFMCPCHGSQYDAEGKKIRGPAPLSLALAHVMVDTTGAIQFTPWTETDFRTGEAPWWK